LVFQALESVLERKLDENESKELLKSLDLLLSSLPRSPEDFHLAPRGRSELHVANHMASIKDSVLFFDTSYDNTKNKI